MNLNKIRLLLVTILFCTLLMASSTIQSTKNLKNVSLGAQGVKPLHKQIEFEEEVNKDSESSDGDSNADKASADGDSASDDNNNDDNEEDKTSEDGDSNGDNSTDDGDNDDTTIEDNTESNSADVNPETDCVTDVEGNCIPEPEPQQYLPDRPTPLPIIQNYQKQLGECLNAWYEFYVEILGKFNFLNLMETSAFKDACANFEDTFFNSGYYCQTLVADFKDTMDDASWLMITLNYQGAQEALDRANKIKGVLPDVCNLEQDGLFYPSSPESKLFYLKY